MARRRPPQRDGSAEPRTFGPWVFVAAFAVLGVVGLLGVLLGLADGGTGQVQLQVDQTTSTTSPSTTELPPAAPATLPDGSPAPAGVSEVVRSGPTTTFAFGVPPAFAEIDLRGEVPPTTATPTGDGAGLTVSVGCAERADEALAQVTITEEATAVTVLAVSLVPVAGPPCAPESTARPVTLPLQDPLAGRRVVVVPAGTAVPTPTPS